MYKSNNKFIDDKQIISFEKLRNNLSAVTSNEIEEDNFKEYLKQTLKNYSDSTIRLKYNTFINNSMYLNKDVFDDIAINIDSLDNFGIPATLYPVGENFVVDGSTDESTKKNIIIKAKDTQRANENKTLVELFKFDGVDLSTFNIFINGSIELELNKNKQLFKFVLQKDSSSITPEIIIFPQIIDSFSIDYQTLSIANKQDNEEAFIQSANNLSDAFMFFDEVMEDNSQFYRGFVEKPFTFLNDFKITLRVHNAYAFSNDELLKDTILNVNILGVVIPLDNDNTNKEYDVDMSLLYVVNEEVENLEVVTYEFNVFNFNEDFLRDLYITAALNNEKDLSSFSLNESKYSSPFANRLAIDTAIINALFINNDPTFLQTYGILMRPNELKKTTNNRKRITIRNFR